MSAPIASGAARGLQLLGGLAIVPALLHRLSHEQFALWMAITSLFMAGGFTDLGLGSALVNRLSARRDRLESARAVSSSICGLALAGAAGALLLAVLYPRTDWNHLFGLAPGAHVRAAPAVGLMILSLCAAAPLSLIGRIRLGLGQSVINNLWDVVTVVLTLAGVLLGAHLGASLTVLVLATAGAPIIASAGNWAHLLQSEPWLTPRWREASWADFTSLLRQGGLFFFIAIFNALAFSCDSLIAVSVFGAKAAAEPMIALRLASAVQTLITGMLLPYWPRLSHATAGSVAARRRALRQAFAFILLISTSAAATLLVLGPLVVHVWTGGAANLPPGLEVPIAIWICTFGLTQGLLTAFSVEHLVKQQLAVAATAGVLVFVGKTWGALMWGAGGLVCGGTAALIGGAVLPMSILLVRDLRRRADAEVIG